MVIKSWMINFNYRIDQPSALALGTQSSIEKVHLIFKTISSQRLKLSQATPKASQFKSRQG